MRKIIANALLDNFGKYSYQSKFSEGYQYYMILYYKIMINEHWNPLSALGTKKNDFLWNPKLCGCRVCIFQN